MSPVAEMIARCRDKPVQFTREVLGRVHPSVPGGLYDKQIDVCRSVLKHRITVVPSGHSTGKTTLLSRVVLWWYACNPDDIVVFVGPTYQQLKGSLWPHLVSDFKASKYPLPGEVKQSPSMAIIDPDNPKHFILGLSADTDPTNLQGKHSPRMLVVCDEFCSANYDAIWPALQSWGAYRYLLVGNPTHHNIMYKLAEEADGDRINKIVLSSLDSPHAHLEDSPVGLASKSLIDSFRPPNGDENDPQWRCRILGLWNDEDSFILIPQGWLDRCTTPHVCTCRAPQRPGCPGCKRGHRWLTVDISGGTGYGDLCVWIISDDMGILAWEASKHWPYPDDVADRVIAAANKWQVHPARVVYDGNGLGAAFGSVLALKGLKGARAYVGSMSGGIEGLTLRDCSAIALRDRLDPNQNPVHFHVPADLLERLRPEIKELRYEIKSQGRIELESKQKMKKRLGHSPDYLDSWIMSKAFN